MNKRGTHVGIIASFSVFILFLVALYVVVEPVISQQKDKDLVINYLELRLLQEFSGNLTTAIISNCSGYMLQIPLADIRIKDSPDLKQIAKDKNNNVIQSQKALGIVNIASTSEDVLWLYLAEVNFNSTGIGSAGDQGLYEVESIRFTKEIFEEKIINGTINFETLKTNLKIPQGTEFSFSFKMQNNTIINAREVNTSLEVIAKEIPIQYYDERANKLNGKINIKIW